MSCLHSCGVIEMVVSILFSFMVELLVFILTLASNCDVYVPE